MSKKSDPETPYTPMNVLNMLKAKGVPVPLGRSFGPVTKQIVDAAGDPTMRPAPIPETCCILLLAFTQGSTMIPDDFAGLEKSGRALRDYTRPDGGVFLGAFQPKGEPDGVVVVFGDPAMSQGAAQKLAMTYRARLIEQFEGHQAQQDLGPFSGLKAAGQPAADTEARLSPAVSQPEMDASES